VSALTFWLRSEPVFSAVEKLGEIVGSTVLKEDHDVVHEGVGTFDHPHAIVMTPVFETLDNKSPIVAYLVGLLPFDRYLGDLLPDGVDDITAVLKNSCNQSFTYGLVGNSVSATRSFLAWLSQSLLLILCRGERCRQTI
jgi:hypothetical protein